MAARQYDMVDYIKIITDIPYSEIMYILNSKLNKDILHFVACDKYGDVNNLAKKYITIIILLKQRMSLSKIAPKFNDTNIYITASNSNAYAHALKKGIFEYGFAMPNNETLKYANQQ